MAGFISSIWTNADLGTYLVNGEVDHIERPDGQLEARYLSFVLLDGQQRLTAIERYVFNEFPVPDIEGKLCFWRELGRAERRLFSNRVFALSQVRSWDEAELRHVHNLRAFGGVRHTEDQRA